MSSGVAVTDEVKTVFDTEMKRNKEHRFVIMGLSADQKEIGVLEKGARDATYKEFQEKLKDDECRYAVFDFEYETSNGAKTQILVFITWCPDTASIKKKMVIASSKDALKKALVGVEVHIQANDREELQEGAILSKIKELKKH